MSKWRVEAIARLPEFCDEINSAENIMALWIELGTQAKLATGNDDLIRRIHDYAKWCANAPRNDDPSRDPPTAVQVSFYEHLDD
jgi:hypothetical protein